MAANTNNLSTHQDMFSKPQESDFSILINKALSRRDFLGGTAKVGMGVFVGSIGLGCANISVRKSAMTSQLFDEMFTPIAANTADTVTVPADFDWNVLVSWGDPLWSFGSLFNESTRGSGLSQTFAFGDNNDGMVLFETKDGRFILAVNNEAANLDIIYHNRASKKPETDDDIKKGKAAHGISIFEIKRWKGQWHIIKDSPYNRRITADTPMNISGPLRGYSKLRTKADPKAIQSLGTWSNCGSGRTPWGTYLSCEENFNVYFSSTDAQAITPEMKRYGIKEKDAGYAWAKTDERFNVSLEPNESNRAGYIVEIDPLNPNSTPKKRTALGRFKHENAELVINKDGRIVVYMGDDGRGEFLYRFVSDGVYKKHSRHTDLLDKGTLYAARFYENGQGEWLPLTAETTGMSDQDICLWTRIAGSKVGATTMDRPEWVAANPHVNEVLCCLTNNKNRGLKPNAGGDKTPVGGPNPRQRNLYGQIVRWRPHHQDHTGAGFDWDLFAMAGNPAVHDDLRRGSSNINIHNMFNSPDGLAFDRNGLLWIQTDGNYSNQGDFNGMGNNQMLLGNTQTGEIKRFLVGPKEAEITGFTYSQDGKTMFVGVQHPGEKGNSHFPNGGSSTPRSSVIAIYRKDGRAFV